MNSRDTDIRITGYRYPMRSERKINMTSTGIVRRIDSVGRFVLPIELRRTLDIDDNDSLEIFVEDNTIILKKYQPACIFCNNARDVSTYKGKNICAECLRDIAKRA